MARTNHGGALNIDAGTARLAGLLEARTDREGRIATALPGVEIFRADGPTPIRCTIYEPCVIIVAQGRKRALLEDEEFDYGPSRYLVLPLSMPLDSHVYEASPERPFLSFAIRVDPTILGQLVLDAGDAAGPDREVGRGIAVSDVDDRLLRAATLLVETLESPADCRVLGAARVREVLYRVLLGPQGRLLRAAGVQDGRLHQVGRALALIHADFARPIEVPELARAAHMSESTFYEAFREVTSRSPVQYVKEVRLNRARQLMVWEGANARRAAAHVGYGSASQFSREFKRRFGRPPGRERAWAIENGELEMTQLF